MTRELAPPLIDGTWSAPRGFWSAPEPPYARGGLIERLRPAGDRAWWTTADEFEAWLHDPRDPGLTRQRAHHRRELPHRTSMHYRYATRRRSRRPARRNR